MNILSKAETWITSQVSASKAMHLALNSLTFFSPHSINHAIDFKMAYYKLGHCLEFNGKIALSPSHLIYTWIICITCSMSSYIIPVLITSALTTQASTSLFPHPPFQSWIIWPTTIPLSIVSHTLSRSIPSLTTIILCLLCAPHSSIHLEKHQSEVFQRAAAWK